MSGATYLLRDVEALLGLSRSAITGLIAAGFISPTRGERREYRFTFQDLVMLRTAHSLRAAQIPTRKILRSLRRLKETLPSDLPLSGLRIVAAGAEVAVRAADADWQIDSGQLLLDFEIRKSAGSVSFLGRTSGNRAVVADDAGERSVGGAAGNVQAAGAPASSSRQSARHWFELGTRLETEDRPQAEPAYRNAIEADAGCVDAYLNLGCLLSDSGRGAEAEALYRAALRHCPHEPRLHFNLALVLEDAQRDAEALECYEACLRLSPDFADAHYNAALLSEALGKPSSAIRHFSAFRRLEKST